MVNIKREGNTITVEGNISKFEDYDAIKLEVESVRSTSGDNIVIRFQDSQSLISALIGYLIKLRRVDNVNMTIYARNNMLYNMLDTLALVEILNVKKG